MNKNDIVNAIFSLELDLANYNTLRQALYKQQTDYVDAHMPKSIPEFDVRPVVIRGDTIVYCIDFDEPVMPSVLSRIGLRYDRSPLK